MGVLEEKHGAIWNDHLPDSGWKLAFEYFDNSTDRLGVIHERAGIFRAAIFQKVDDYRSVLPWWSMQSTDALYDDKDEAIRNVEVLLAAPPRFSGS